jgi:hypothetical protein
MRGCGRSCRGPGRVFVKLVRHTAHQLLALGEPIKTFALQATERLEQARTLREAQRPRLPLALTTALSHHEDLRKQSTRLTQGKKLGHYKLVNAYAPPIAPIIKGKSNCPAQCGRKPGIASEPATGFIFATLVPQGNPSDPSYGLPLLDKVQRAMERVQSPQRPRVHSVAGDRGLNDAVWRQALHARGILTVGIPKTVEPLRPNPRPEEVLDILNEAGLNRQRTPHQVHLGYGQKQVPVFT